MKDLHFPWLEACIVIPLIGAICMLRSGHEERSRKLAIAFSGLSFLCAVGAWIDFDIVGGGSADDCWHILSELLGIELFVIDAFSTPFLPMLALLFLLTTWATLPNQSHKFSYSRTLVSQSIVLATFTCREPWVIIALLAAGTVPPYLELRERGHSTRVYRLHMGLFVALMVLGWAAVTCSGPQAVHSAWAVAPLACAVFIRAGIVPFHCWMADLFEHATFGTALLFVTPISGAYLAVRLVLPIAPEGVLNAISLASLLTAVYAAGMALVQREARRFACYLFLSHSALVLVGLDLISPIGLTGALCVWLSVALGMGGFGLTLRALEARRGRLSLVGYQGLYGHTTSLAMCFVLTGLASIGFPGTFGFVGTELLIDGVVAAYPLIGIAVVLAAALNGIAVIRAYFLLFTGVSYVSSISLGIRARERYAVLTLAAIILAGGLLPQPGVASRYRAAEDLLSYRQQLARSGATPRGDHAFPVPVAVESLDAAERHQ